MAQGQLHKMHAVLDPDVGGVRYALQLADDLVDMNAYVGNDLTVRFTGELTCVNCGTTVKKFYGQGFCWPCLSTAPEASDCIVRPELCRAHLGEGRDVQWEKDHHLQEHFVYLSQTGALSQDPTAKGGIKVGVTRGTQVPVRWIDQGAVAAVIIARTPHRHLAGLIEVQLKKVFADKTNWRAMLAPVAPELDALSRARAKAMEALAYELGAYALATEMPTTIAYPVNGMPQKVNSVSLEKQAEVSGTLAGIKGQYLIWSDGRVLNVRNHGGYHVSVE